MWRIWSSIRFIRSHTANSSYYYPKVKTWRLSLVHFLLCVAFPPLILLLELYYFLLLYLSILCAYSLKYWPNNQMINSMKWLIWIKIFLKSTNFIFLFIWKKISYRLEYFSSVMFSKFYQIYCSAVFQALMKKKFLGFFSKEDFLYLSNVY